MFGSEREKVRQNEMPSVSVCMPVFNYGHMIGEAIESVLMQDYPNWQLLISDNCSTDQTGEVAASICRRDGRVRYFRNSSNVGYARNVNCCLQKAVGKYTTILAADDLYLSSDFLSCAVKVMEQHSRLAFLHSAFWELDQAGRRLTEMKYFHSDQLFSGREEFQNLLDYTYVYISTAVIRSESLRKLGGMNPEAGSFADWDLFCRLALTGDIYFSSHSRVGIRQHDSRIMAQKDVRESDSRTERGLQFYRQLSDSFSEASLKALCRRAEEKFAAKSSYIEKYNPGYLQGRVANLVKNWNLQSKRVLVYGAGFHTERLLTWTCLEDARLVGFADSNRRKQGIKILNLPVVSPQDIETLAPDVILISSNAYEEEIYGQLTKLRPAGVEITRLYGQEEGASRQNFKTNLFPPRPPLEDFQAVTQESIHDMGQKTEMKPEGEEKCP